jgi:hypothetical protein
LEFFSHQGLGLGVLLGNQWFIVFIRLITKPSLPDPFQSDDPLFGHSLCLSSGNPISGGLLGDARALEGQSSVEECIL